jgi:hypothetical protein
LAPGPGLVDGRRPLRGSRLENVAVVAVRALVPTSFAGEFSPAIRAAARPLPLSPQEREIDALIVSAGLKA